ncbi:MAG: hypothetical protein ACOC87_02555 [Candidatus Natronoplasma sp.]
MIKDRDVEKSEDKTDYELGSQEKATERPRWMRAIELVGTDEDQDAVAFRCKYCQYTWNTKSERAYVSCPNCYRQTKFKEGALDRLQVEGEVASLLLELTEEKEEDVGIEELLIEALALWKSQRGGIDE